ncbi:MAG TPA: MmcQ/YjbR family DNA-binding protein [Gaiellaceae bacterium]|nr:MmcQ/YjbR family DNA-binding protein [Gaiellaceae bacterium]
MSTMRDLDKLALALPQAEKEVSEDGRPTYSVHGKFFCFHRSPRPDALDENGARLEDVLVFRVDGAEIKELLLADARGIFFTTPHWNGYSAVLLRIPDLAQIDKDELKDLLADAWLTRAQKRVAKAWLAENNDR